MNPNMTVSDSELEILEVLWTSDCALNAAEIRNILNEHKNWERTTILTLINRLVKKGAIAQEKREVYYYTPCIRRETYVRAETKSAKYIITLPVSSARHMSALRPKVLWTNFSRAERKVWLRR